MARVSTRALPVFPMKHLGITLLGFLEVIRGIACVIITLALLAGVAAGVAMLFFGKAPAKITVPHLQGSTVPEAERTLQPLGLTLRVTGRDYSPTVKQDTVLRSRPYEGKQVKRGRVVEVVLSLGARSVTLPKVVGLPVDAADGKLADAGLRVAEIRRKASDRPRDEVLEQIPGAGKQVGRDDSIVLIASGGSSFGLVSAKEGAPWVFRRVRITVPRGPALQRVQVLLPDAPEEERTAYDRVHRPGDQVSVSIVARKGWRLQALVMDKQVHETAL